MISIGSKPTSHFRAFCSSSIRNRCIRSSLYVAASSLTRIHSRRRQLVSYYTSVRVFLTSLSSVGICLKSDEKTQCNSRIHVCPLPRATLTATSRSPGSLGLHYFKSDEKTQCNSRSPVCPRPRATLTAISRGLGSLGFPGNSSFRDARSISVFYLLALSPSALDRWRLGG